MAKPKTAWYLISYESSVPEHWLCKRTTDKRNTFAKVNTKNIVDRDEVLAQARRCNAEVSDKTFINSGVTYNIILPNKEMNDRFLYLMGRKK